jgi:hypothetical protein
MVAFLRYVENSRLIRTVDCKLMSPAIGAPPPFTVAPVHGLSALITPERHLDNEMSLKLLENLLSFNVRHKFILWDMISVHDISPFQSFI